MSIKSKQLGIPFGTACHRLRKIVLFHYVKKAGEANCFKCTLPIEIVEDLTIEHKLPWQGKDNKLFWDLSNIAFSHKKCNKKAPLYPNGRPHGTYKKYDIEGCRCPECKIAKRESRKRQH